MALRDITNEVKFDVPTTFKRRRLENRRHSLIPAANRSSMLSFKYRQTEGPQLMKHETNTRRHSYAPIRSRRSIAPCTQPVDDSLHTLRTEYKDSQTRYLSLETAIEKLKQSHEHDMETIKKAYIVTNETLKTQFEQKLKNIELAYCQKVESVVEINTAKCRTKLDSLNKEIDKIKSNIDHLSSHAFKEKQKEIRIRHDKTVSILREEHLLITGNLENQKAKLQQQLSNAKVALDNYCNVIQKKLQSRELELQGKIAHVFEVQNELDSNEMCCLSTIKKLKADLALERDEINNMQDDVKRFLLEQSDYEKLLLAEQESRRQLHNTLQEKKGNIRVFCRLKPSAQLNEFETKIQSLSKTNNGQESLEIKEPARNTGALSGFKSNSYKFTFDIIFDQNSSNEDIFVEISQLVQSALDGYNVCIFTYGQTGSGKTYTMSNPNDGLIPRSIHQIFERMETLSSLGWCFELYGQFFELYGDSINDLLTKNKSTGNDVNHIQKIRLRSVQHINAILAKANMMRSTAATNSNHQSSRSHSIFKFSITGKDNEGVVYTSVLNLIDLAGSERISSSLVKGTRLKETQAINKSLSALGDVINALSLKCNHVPFRNSKLTYLLKDSLGGDSKTLMFVNVSCLKEHFSESLNSLRFANKVHNTKIK